MTSPSEFMPLFAECKTVQDTNKSYRQAIALLQEAHRLAMLKVVGRRDEAVTKRSPQNEAQTALEATQRSHDTLIRQWATAQGIPFQRVSKKLRQQYEEAHDPAM